MNWLLQKTLGTIERVCTSPPYGQAPTEARPSKEANDSSQELGLVQSPIWDQRKQMDSSLKAWLVGSH